MDLPERKSNPFTKSTSGGRTISALMLPFFLLLPPKGFGVLITTGRRTGKRRRKCIHAIRQGDRVYVVMIRPVEHAIHTRHISAWVLNIRANATVELRLRDGIFTGLARELTEPADIAHAEEAYCRTINRFDYVECMFHRSGRPTRAKIEELHRSWFEHGVPLVIELQTGSQAASDSS
jgi:deazaflavin-dependent oxidoreductase (nitroreductase family)